MGFVIIVVAPSGCGKSTLIGEYIKNNKDTKFSISYTTRQKRGNEKDGVHYHFVDVDTFKQMIENGSFLEWAQVHDNYYGTSKNEIETLEDNQTLILDIDVQGAIAAQRLGIKALYIFIKPPSIESLKERLQKRASDTNDVIEKRLWNAKRELEYEYAFDTVIVNDELTKTQIEFNNLIDNYKNNF